MTSSAATLTVAAAVPVVTIIAGGDGDFEEGGPKGHFVFIRAGGDTTAALTVYYKVKGTAANGTRYTGPGGVALSGTVVIPAGATLVKLKVRAVNDTAREGTEKIKLVLKASPTATYTIGAASKAILFELDND